MQNISPCMRTQRWRDVINFTNQKFRMTPLVYRTEDTDFGVQSYRIFMFFWIGYRFPLNRTGMIQMK